MSKYFLLIAGQTYYPSQGTDDWLGCYETMEEAESCVIHTGSHKYPEFKINNIDQYHWYKIVDLRNWINK